MRADWPPSMLRAAEMPSIAIGVFISPGIMTLARMLYFALPNARASAKAFTPAFEVL